MASIWPVFQAGGYCGAFEAPNPVRFIDAFVDRLNLAAAGFIRVAPEATGRPGYAPCDLLKLYIYGYLNRVR
jgi:transposase